MPRANDPIEKATEKEFKRLSKEIEKVYKQAAKEVEQKLADFLAKSKAREAYMLGKVKAGLMTEAEFKTWKTGQVFIGDLWKRKLDDVTKVYVNADKKARELVGGTTKNVFAEAANYTAWDIGKHTGSMAFNLYNPKTVETLLRKNKKLLPKWKINEKKDYIWNAKRVKNVITQGIIQGESIPDIGARLTEQLAASNASKMEMFARTAVTGAQNTGRLERMREASENGIKVQKMWVATLDSRTRDAHADLDGQVVDYDKDFQSILGPISCPGDPSAKAANVYNCRCRMKTVYPDVELHGQRRDNETGEIIGWMTYKEWKKAKGG